MRYANDFYDVTTGNNQADPDIPGYPATPGWDPVTGLGTPNAAELLPDLVAAVRPLDVPPGARRFRRGPRFVNPWP